MTTLYQVVRQGWNKTANQLEDTYILLENLSEKKANQIADQCNRVADGGKHPVKFTVRAQDETQA